MTDRNPDDLYDALRDRLADYGQEPPAPLWASIRAQLPPPVAQPQLRKRRRRAALLGLLLLLVSVGSWQWWRAEHYTGRTAADIATISSVKSSQTAGLNQPNTEGNQIKSSEINNANDGQSNSTAAANTVTSAAGPQANSSPSLIATGPNSAAEAGKPFETRTRKAERKLLAARSTAIQPPSRSHFLLGPNQGAGRMSTGRASRDASTAATKEGKSITASSATAATNGVAFNNLRRRRRTKAAARGAVGRGATATAYAVENYSAKASKLLPAGSEADAKTLGNTALNSPKTPASHQSQSLKQPAAPRPAIDSAAAATAAASVPAATSFVAWSQLQPRRIGLVVAPWAMPGVRPVADTFSRPALPAARHWAVQVLAGPALTYRRLGTASSQLQSASPISSIPTVGPTGVINSFSAATSNVAQLERPALSGGAQVSVRRTLGKQWDLSAGLGYTEYATRLALQQVKSTSYQFAIRQDSAATSIHQRDTYRFVTVPVRLSYGWTLTGRWRVGLLAGVDAAFYIGGSSTEGSACACQTQHWGLSGSPYRRFSLGASLGAEVRYRLTDRWELLAQPTATYLLTPLAQSAAYYERHLFGGTALLGVSYDLP